MKPLSLAATLGISLFALLLQSGAVFADERDAFRVCADPKNLPFSHKDGSGFENKLAEIWAQKLDRPLEYTWFPQRRGFVRKTLKSQDQAGTYKCDVIMGVADGFDSVMTTTPYYRSTYVLIYVKGRGLDDVATSGDFAGLDEKRKKKLRIGAFTPTPGTAWLARHGMTEQTVAFVAMSGDPEAYPGEIIEKELIQGQLDAVVIWGPIGGYFAHQTDGVELAVIPLRSEPGIQFEFSIVAGVRYGDGESKKELEDLIAQTSDDITTLLTAYHVPLLEP